MVHIIAPVEDVWMREFLRIDEIADLGLCANDQIILPFQNCILIDSQRLPVTGFSFRRFILCPVRIRKFDQAGGKIVLTTGDLQERAAAIASEARFVYDVGEIDTDPGQVKPVAIDPDQTAALLSTSGSTGRPKPEAEAANDP